MYSPFVSQHKQRATSGENSLIYHCHYYSLLLFLCVFWLAMACFIHRMKMYEAANSSLFYSYQMRCQGIKFSCSNCINTNFLLYIRIDTIIRNSASYDSFFIYVLCIIIHHDVVMIATLLIIDGTTPWRLHIIVNIDQNIINARTN